MNAKLTSTLLILGLLIPSAVAWAQDKEQITADPTEHLTTLAVGLKERKTNDDDQRHDAETKIVEALDLLLLDYNNYDEKQKKLVIGAISKIFKVRTPENEDRIYIGAAACLSEMGPAAESDLKSAMKIKHLEKRIDVQVMLIEALGKHKNEKNVDFFIKLMRTNENQILVAAIKSLSEYRDSEAKVRKQIAEELVKQYASANSLNTKEKGKNPVFKDRFYAIEVPMNEALAALTLQSFQSSPEWEKWFNDNRNKRW